MLIRSLGIAITIAALSWPSVGLGLGLGEIIVESTLASPFKASIPLNGMDRIGLDTDQFYIRLDGASKLKIQYRLERTDTDTARIILYTRKAVTEPLFQFRIEVEWDEGMVARRYDVLIDPPSYQLNPPVEEIITSVPDENSAIVSDPVATNHSANSSVIETDLTRSEYHTGEPGSPIAETRRKYGPTVSGNSIWRVARKVATGSKELSIYQWMYGLWKANPQAFTRSNMHRLKIHELISVPFEWEVMEISRSEAYQTYTRHLAKMEVTTQAGETVAGGDPEPIVVVEPVQQVVTEKLVFEELAVTAVEGPPATAAVVNMEKTGTSLVVNALRTPAVEVLNEGEVNLDLPGILDTGDQSEVIIVGAGTAIEPPAVRSKTNNESQAEWSSALQSRTDYIEQLPVIGSGAPLAILGRVLQQADEFISSRPVWWVMVFSVWVTLVLFMLSQEFRSRPGPIRDLRQKVSDLVLRIFTTRESIQVSASVTDSLRNLAKQNESDDPVEIGEINTDVGKIMSEADVSVAKGETDKAVESIEASLDIQPDQGLTMHLLEAYYNAGDAKAFETLAKHFKSVIGEMDTSEQVYVQAMYSELCPNSSYLIDQGYLTDPNIVIPAAHSKPDCLEEDDEFLATQIIIRNNEAEAPTEEPEAVAGPVVEEEMQDETLDEVDVYIAYGLSENAEELLTLSIKASPGRADYRAKLLDIHFATRNVVDFMIQAKALKEMGDAANRYWDRVQVMGYELAPGNELFSGARDSSLSASDLGIAKPESADFDLGSDVEDDSPIAETDILLSGDSGGLVDVDVDTQKFIETVSREDEAVENKEEAPAPGESADDLSEIEFALDADDEEPVKTNKGDTTNFELTGDLLGNEEIDSELENLSLEFTGAEEVELEPLGSAIFDLPDDINEGGEENASESEEASIETSGVEEDDIVPLDAVISVDEDDVDSNSHDGRILCFPNSLSDNEKSSEFKSEVQITLQSIRDQMQQINERMFSQERSSNNLKKAINELNELSNLQSPGKRKISN